MPQEPTLDERWLLDQIKAGRLPERCSLLFPRALRDQARRQRRALP
jgi:hypothetical protein